MSQKTLLLGTCSRCGRRFSRASMTRHLSACGSPAAGSSGERFHLFVALRDRGSRRDTVELLARNDAPEITCGECLRRIERRGDLLK